jgi:hypothetical protein
MMARSAVDQAAELDSKMGENKQTEDLPAASAKYAPAKRALKEYRDKMKRLPGVIGFSIGPCCRKHRFTSEITIRLHVATEEAKDYLRRNAVKLGLRKYYEGVETEVVALRFRVASGGGPGLPNGSKIHGGTGFGSLGTTVAASINFKKVLVWTTAAHVVADKKPATKVEITDETKLRVIGTVSPADYFRDEQVDFAYIVPSTPLNVMPLNRNVPTLDDSDIGTEVTMDGALSGHSTGVITSVSGSGELVDTGEKFSNHILVESETGSFASKQDSGAMVRIGNSFIGVLRGVGIESNTRVAIVSKLDVVRSRTGSELRGFIL